MSTEEARMEPVAGPAPEATTEAPADAPADTTSSAKPAPDVVLADELREFGKQIEGLFNTARTSTRGKDIETQLTAAWRDVEKGVNTAINRAQTSDLKGTVSGTAQYAGDELQTGLAKGLKSLNMWLGQKRATVEERRKAREAAAASGAKMTEDEVTDRFGTDEPVFGGISVPAMNVEIKPEPNEANADNEVADRFSGNPPTL